MSVNSILEEAQSLITGNRNASYGKAFDNFETIARLWDAYWDRRMQSKGGSSEFFPADVAVFMILVKVARLAHEPKHKDSKVDIAGYAALMEDVLRDE